MKARSYLLLALFGVGVGMAATFGPWASPSAAQPGGKAADASRASDEAALLKSAGAFVEAFGKGDAKALAAFWSPEGDYTGPAGVTVSGRAAIEKAFTEYFTENKGVTLRIDVGNYRFPTPDVAIEDGTTTVITADGAPQGTMRYTIVHAKKDGKWLIESVREAPYTPPSNHQHLRGLDWLVGEWVDDVKDGEMAQISFAWTENENFLLSHFHTALKGAVIASGTQWIGWDPTTKSVRSWMFESHGGFGSGLWSKDAGKWTIKASTTLPDGKITTATNIVTRVDVNTLTWEVKDRILDGKTLPEIRPVKMKRVEGQ